MENVHALVGDKHEKLNFLNHNYISYIGSFEPQLTYMPILGLEINDKTMAMRELIKTFKNRAPRYFEE